LCLILILETTNIYNKIKSEIDFYLTLQKISLEEDPLVWWNQKKVVLPNLAVQARIYLAIPASSVPSERLFSSAGNVFTKKRNRLSKNSIHNILFLKENSKLFK
jgi:hypothetical protein